MTPIKFTIKDGVTHFHYKFSEIMNFVRLGKKDGNVGVILTKREGNLLTYRGYGTIENPFRHLTTFEMMHFEPIDGKMLTDEERLIPKKPFFKPENITFTMMDFSSGTPIDSINK